MLCLPKLLLITSTEIRKKLFGGYGFKTLGPKQNSNREVLPMSEADSLRCIPGSSLLSPNLRAT